MVSKAKLLSLATNNWVNWDLDPNTTTPGHWHCCFEAIAPLTLCLRWMPRWKINCSKVICLLQTFSLYFVTVMLPLMSLPLNITFLFKWWSECSIFSTLFPWPTSFLGKVGMWVSFISAFLFCHWQKAATGEAKIVFRSTTKAKFPSGMLSLIRWHDWHDDTAFLFLVASSFFRKDLHGKWNKLVNNFFLVKCSLNSTTTTGMTMPCSLPLHHHFILCLIISRQFSCTPLSPSSFSFSEINMFLSFHCYHTSRKSKTL